MPQVLFLCTGNICRSAFAERYAATLAGPGSPWSFASAGIAALVGEPMDALMAEQLEARGGSARGFSARQVTRQMLSEADLIVGMETVHRTYVLEEFPARMRTAFTLGQLGDQVMRGVSRGDDFLAELTARRTPAKISQDIPDPYRQGEPAAARTAQRISGLLDSFVPRLARVAG